MKTVTSNFKDYLSRVDPAVKRAVYYKRRYWQDSTKTYVWEAAWTILTEENIQSVSAINWTLDTNNLNEFKVSNVTLNVRNLQNEWKTDNPYGVFGSAAVSPQGFEPYWTKFQIKAGVDYRDTTTELVTIFTGLATEYVQDAQRGTMSITLTGLESLLINADAERVSTRVVNEAAGTGNGIVTAFNLAHTGVGVIDEVSLDGITKRAGNDYSVTNLNDTVNAGRVTFTIAPGSGQAVRISYRYWKTVQKFEDLIVALLNEAGVDPGNQHVDPVLFPSKVINRRSIGTQADWQAGSLAAIDTGTLVNSIKIDYSDPTLARQSTTWNDGISGWILSAGALQTPTFSPTVQSGSIPAGIVVNTANQTIFNVTTNFTGETVSGSGQSTGFLNNPTTLFRVTNLAFRIVPQRSGILTQINCPVVVDWPSGAATYTIRGGVWSESGGQPGTRLSSATQTYAATYTLQTLAAFTLSQPVTAGTAYWIVFEEDAATPPNCIFRFRSINVAVQNWSGGGNAKARFINRGTGCSGDPAGTSIWQDVETSLTNGPIGNIAGSYTVVPAAVALSATWTSPTYDVNPFAYGTAVTVQAAGSYGATTSGTVYVDGSSDGSTWTQLGSQSNPGGSYSYTVGVYRYWRLRVSVSTTDDRNTAVINAPSLQFSSSAAAWSTGAHGLTYTPSPGLTQTSGWAYRPNFKSAGRWDMDFKEATTNSDTNMFWWHFMFQSVGSLGANNFFNGYSIKVILGSAPSIKFIRNDSATIGTETEIASASITRDATQNHHIQVYRTAVGRFVVLYDGAQKIDVTDTTYPTGNYIGYHINAQSSEGWELGWYPLYVPPDSITASWYSSTIDAGGTPQAWTPIGYTADTNGGSLAFYTRSSANGSTWDPWVSVPANLQVQSTLKRYAQIRVDPSASLLNGSDPIVHSISFGSITVQTVIQLANFTGQTVYDAISDLAKFANYEWGFTPDEQFFFRSKIVGTTPVIAMDQANYLMSLNSVNGGFENTYSIVRATYGNYQKDVTDDGVDKASPLPRYARQRLDIDGGDLLISADADVASGVASSFFNYYKNARRTFKVTTKFLPQVDLSDTVKLSFLDNYPTKLWNLGDLTVYLGQLDINLYGGAEQILSNTLGKVVGIRLDTERWTNEFDFEEILL